jgi:hypothetical protein
VVKIFRIRGVKDARIQVRFSEEVENEKNRFDFYFIVGVIFS